MKAVADHTTTSVTRAQRASGNTPFFSPAKEKESSGVATAEPFFQPKLKVGAPNDKYEQEADAVADRVVQRMVEEKARPQVQSKVGKSSEPSVQRAVAAPTLAPLSISRIQRSTEAEPEEQAEPETEEVALQRKPIFDSDGDGTIQRKCAACEANEEGGHVHRFPAVDLPTGVQRKCAACEAEEKVQPKAMPPLQRSGDGGFTASSDFSSRLASGRGGGSPLPASTQESMGSAIGADFSGVRVHTGSEAAGLSNDIGAQAFTHGSDVYFNEGKYDPGSLGGQRLLAHELTHTVQQGGSIQRQVAEVTPISTAGTLELQRFDLDLPSIPIPEFSLPSFSLPSFDLPGSSFLSPDFLDFDLPGFELDFLEGLRDIFNFRLPDSPIEALEMILSIMDSEAFGYLENMFPGLSGLKATLRAVLEFLKLIDYILSQKEAIIEEFRQFVEGKLDAVAHLAHTHLKELFGFLDERHFTILWEAYLLPMLTNLKDNWWQTVKDGIWEQIWPFEGITTITDIKSKRKGLGKDLGDLWDNIVGLFEHLADFELSRAVDSGLLIQKNLVTIVNRFSGWITLLLVAVPTISGAVAGAAAGGVGAIPGGGAGFAAGAAAAAEFGYVLLAITAAVEGAIILKSALSLNGIESSFVDEDKAKLNHFYYKQIAESSLALSLMAAMAVLASIGGRIATKLLGKVIRFLPKKYQAVFGRLTQILQGKKGKGEIDALEARTNPPEIQGELKALGDATKNPDRIKSVSDPELMKNYDFEVRLDGHTYRRRKSDGTWCRFSKTLCNIDGLEGVNAQVDKAMGVNTGIGTKFQVGERITMPYKRGKAQAEIVRVTDDMITVHYPSKTKGKDIIEHSMPIERFERLIEEGTILRWSAERTRLMENRPKYADGQVEKVWQRAVDESPDGIVRDPHTDEVLNWDPDTNRWTQWHMGHKKGHKYSELVDDYVDGKISWEKFMEEYYNPDNYHPEHPIENVSRRHD